MTTPVETSGAATGGSGKGLRIGLWVAQGLLAAVFAMAGTMKLITPIAEQAKKMTWVTPDNVALIRFIGASELAGALGVLLPALTRILPSLTSLAAAGLTVVMILAAGFHISRGEYNHLPVPLVLGALAAFVAWGRYRKAPILPR